MQMKHLLVALLVLLALVGTAAAADSVEIRSTVLDFETAPTATTGIDYATLGTGTDAWKIDATNWAGLYYDLDTNLSTEVIAIRKTAATSPTVDIKYQTTAKLQAYDYDKNTPWDTDRYAVMGFFAEPYVALSSGNLTGTVNTPAGSAVNPGKMAKLIIDSNDVYLLKTGATLELGDGYSLIVDQIDVDGNKAYIKFMKDNRELNSSIVTADTSAGGDWIFTLTVLGEKDTQVLRAHIKSVFQGTQDSLVEIDGLWLIDYLNAKEIKSGDDFGKFEDANIGTDTVTFEAKNISISEDVNTEIGNGIYVQTSKAYTATLKEFYLYKEYTTPGVYDIRSSVFTYGVPIAGAATTDVGYFDYKNFAAFFYDLEDGAYDEKLQLTSADGIKVVKDTGLIYTTAPKMVNFDYQKNTWTGVQYSIMGLFGEKYVPLSKEGVASTTPAKMAKLIIDTNDVYLLKTGATLELGEGYSLIVDQIDVDGNKAYIKFMKDNRELNSSIVTADTSAGGDWVFDLTVLSEKDTQVLRVHVKSVFQGTESSLVEIDGLWLIDYLNATEIKDGDMFGVLKATPSSSNIIFKLDSDLTISSDMDKQIANNMYLKTSGNASNKLAYFYVAAEVGEGSTGPTQPDVPDVPDVPDTPKPDVPDTPKPDVPETPDTPDAEKTFWQKYMWHIIIAIVLIIIIAGAAYYFLVMKKQ